MNFLHITKWKLLSLEHWGRQGFIFGLPTSYMRLYFPSEWTMCYNCPLLYLPPQSVRLLFSPYTFTLCLSVWRWKYENKIYSLQSQYSDKECKLGVYTFPGGKRFKALIFSAKTILLVDLHVITVMSTLINILYVLPQAVWSEETYAAYWSNFRRTLNVNE